MKVRDRLVVRAAWRALEGAGRVVGPERARRLAAVVWSRTAARGDRFLKLAHRVSPRLRNEHPRLFKVPAAWTSGSPLVRVRRSGFNWELDLRDNLQALLFFAGTYEPELVAFLETELRRGDVFADVGANIGIHSLIAARALAAAGGGRVYAFEPAEDTAAKLQRAAGSNDVDVEVVTTALGAEPGVVDLFADPNYDEADTGVRSQFTTGRPVGPARLTTFDLWAEGRGLDRLDVVKIDVEGAEPLVLEGMQASLRAFRPRAVIVEMREYSFQRVGHGSPAELRRVLERFGYRSTGQVLNHNEVFAPAPPS